MDLAGVLWIFLGSAGVFGKGARRGRLIRVLFILVRAGGLRASPAIRTPVSFEWCILPRASYA